MRGSFLRTGACIASLSVSLAFVTGAQETLPPGSAATLIASLPLDAASRATLRDEIARRDYTSAEDQLANAATRNPRSQPLLLALANVLFLDGKQLNCAVVLKKAELLGALDERSRFLLALSYIAVSRKNPAIRELEKLEQSNPVNAVYPYWLSRLNYRKMDLQLALTYAQKAVRLDSGFMKAYDQLGLCYAGLNHTDDAIQAYERAALLNRQQSLHSPWPAMNLGTLLRRLDRLDEAEAQLRDSVSIDPRFPTAHLRLGQVLERRERFDEAVAELNEAARLDPTYPEPHYTLARIYSRRQDRASADRELKLFQELRETDKRKGITRPD